MKQFSLLFSVLFLGKTLFSQSIEDGIKNLNYEKYTTAQGIFSKLVAANPNDVNAVYWLGQAYLQNDDDPDTAAARALYQKTLQANPNAPLMIVGMGQIDLMEGHKDEARNKFETALTIPKKRELPPILVAVGRANVDAKDGDAHYAIDKLNQATDRDKKDPEIYVLLGDAYRKLIDGANATLSYQKALSLDPNDARADFMIGRIYETQGYGQEPIYMKYYDAAIAADPNFAPIYYWLYRYYYERDVNKSRDYLNKYIALADPSPKNCYYQASLLYVSKLYKEAISKSDECISGGGTKVYPNLWGLKAYAYDKLGDSIDAKTNFQQYFDKVDTSKLGPNDYATFGRVLLKLPPQDSLARIANDSLATAYINKAVAMDTVEANKVEYLTTTAQWEVDNKDYGAAAKWFTRILKVKKDFNNVDIFNAGYNDYRSGDYVNADSAFAMYMDKYPKDIFGAYMRARASEGIDTAETMGLALPYYQRVIDLADSANPKSNADKAYELTAYRFMVAYYYNTKKDIQSAYDWNSKILAAYPDDPQAQANDKALKELLARQQKAGGDKGAPEAKDSTSTGK
ncbi:MAG: tetratricopeptide repeat protein [Bacteroidota bacterium]|nr:tetratricopeptide repeat protein [Bacteroidota bacterium]